VRGTQKALMARGLDSAFAAKLANEQWTLSKLKLAPRAELKTAGLRDDFIDELFKDARPPIPISTLMNVLFANRYQCCVCRNSKLSVIVHHIDEWAKSRQHNIENLAVLCLHHHDVAHSQKTLSKNLDLKTLKDSKDRWEKEVKRFDAETILDAMRLHYSNWNYMNELRVFEVAKTLEIAFEKTQHFSELVNAGLVQPNGLPAPVNDNNLYYMYQGPNFLARYFYVSEILNLVVQQLLIVNISDYLDKGLLGFALVRGDFIFVQGSHVFSPITDKKSGKGRGQICEGVRKANNVEVRFTFDRWEASSSSAKNCWLVGTRNQGSLIHVKDLSRNDGRLIIRGTVLGICSNLGELKKREYAQRWIDWMPQHHDEVEAEDDGLDDL
jgi:hypothetical protein